MLENRRGNDAEIHDVVTAGKQAADDALAEHDSAGTGVASHENVPALVEERSERRGEVENASGRKALPDDTTDADMRDS